MGAFNILTADVTCPCCHTQARRQIQFKYADTWQLEYKLGDCLLWGGNDVGRPARRVILDGAGGDCPNCGCEADYEILVENNILAAVRYPLHNDYFLRHHASYLIEEP